MTSASRCARIRPDLGVYVLGAISPAGRARVARHLETCSRCREELAGLAGLPGLLARLPPATAARIASQDAPAGDPVTAGLAAAALAGRIARQRRQRQVLAVSRRAGRSGRSRDAAPAFAPAPPGGA